MTAIHAQDDVADHVRLPRQMSGHARAALVALAGGPLVAWQRSFVPLAEADAQYPTIQIPRKTIAAMTKGEMVTCTRRYLGRETVRLTDTKGRRYARSALAEEADRLIDPTGTTATPQPQSRPRHDRGFR